MNQTNLAPREADALIPVQRISRDQHPAWVYLASLSEGSRRTMASALDTIAQMITDGGCTLDTMPWHQLRYQHTQAIRAQLAARYAPAMANKMLASVVSARIVLIYTPRY